MKILASIAAAAAAMAWAFPTFAQTACGNPGGNTYHPSPRIMAPDGTRGIGLTINVRGAMKPVPDLRARCLPIAVRYNNFGVLKTPAQRWRGQIDRDSKGHAVFGTTEAGVAAWGEWIKRRTASGPKSALELMSLYAPVDDCVGSIGTPPNCPHGINPTRRYATRIAASLEKGVNDKLNLDGTDCREGREALYAFFSQVATFEIGEDFCAGVCGIDRSLFDRAMDGVWGPVRWGPCADPPEAHEQRE
jgi:hypothetical protein